MWIDERTGQLRLRTPGLCTLTVLACLSLVAAPAFGQRADDEGSVTIKIEAETYLWGHDACGDPNSVSCETGSGGKAVYGLDCAGDWIMLKVLVPQPTFFKISLCSAEDIGLRARFAIEFVPLGSGVSPGADTLTTAIGRGAG